jgi:hypothetical protein
MSRRTFLRGTGAAVALPLLEAMVPAGSAAGDGKPPVRLVFLHTESGMWMPRYRPARTGTDYELSPTLEPLKDYKEDFSVLSGLLHVNAFKRNPVHNRHSQDSTCFLTAADLSRVPGVAAKNSISVDQVAAGVIGDQTRIPSMALSVYGQRSISYTDSGAPVPAETDPRVVFAQLFAEATAVSRAEAERRFRQNQSILDEVTESARSLGAQLGARDRDKVDEYLTNVRAVERRLQQAHVWTKKPPAAPPAGTRKPGPVPEMDRGAHVRLLLDMVVLALQTDQTRLATVRVGFMNCRYPQIGCPDGYHGYTHHGFRVEKQECMAKVDRARIGHMAYFLGKLKAVREGDADLLHNCLIHYGSGMGMSHEGTDLPTLLAGHGGGAVRPGRHNDYKGKPLANLFVTMLHAAGVPVPSFVDSTGPLSDV